MEKIEKVLLLAVLGVALMIITVMSFVPEPQEEVIPGEQAGAGQAGTGGETAGPGEDPASGDNTEQPGKSLAELLGADAPRPKERAPEGPAQEEAGTEPVVSLEPESGTPVFQPGSKDGEADNTPGAKEKGEAEASIAMLEFAQNPDYLVYKVRKGDTLSQIAERVCGTQLVVEDLLKVNEGVDRDSIQPGQSLLIPKWVRDEGQKRAASRPPRKEKVTEGAAATDYTVQKGDSLWKIASRHVQGQKEVPAYVKMLQDLNPTLAGGVLRPGMKLRLPDAADAASLASGIPR